MSEYDVIRVLRVLGLGAVMMRLVLRLGTDMLGV
jgi:hypothetical protein